MSSIRDAIDTDMKRYRALCQLFNEQVQMDDGWPDCYGKHSRELEQRLQARVTPAALPQKEEVQ